MGKGVRCRNLPGTANHLDNARKPIFGNPGTDRGYTGNNPEYCKAEFSPVEGLVHTFLDSVEVNARREVAGQVLIDAALNCGSDAVPFLELIHSVLSPDWPMPSPYANLMAEAREWARIASTAQRKAWALACFELLADRDQDAFLALLEERASA